MRRIRLHIPIATRTTSCGSVQCRTIPAKTLRWSRDCWEALNPYVDQAVYVNALDDGAEEGELRVRQAYGTNYDRLKTLKRKRSEEHTSELQSHLNLVCRLL